MNKCHDLWQASCLIVRPSTRVAGAAWLGRTYDVQSEHSHNLLILIVRDRPRGRVVAIVRAGSDQEAARRLRSSFDSGDADLLRTYDALSAKHLTVYTGMAPAQMHSPSCGLSLKGALRITVPELSSLQRHWAAA